MNYEAMKRLAASNKTGSIQAGPVKAGRLQTFLGTRKLVMAAGLVLLAPLALRAQQPYGYPVAPQYGPPQYAPPQYVQPQYAPAAPQYSQQAPYPQQGAEPAYQQPQYEQPQQYNEPQAADAESDNDPMGGTVAPATPTQAPLSADQLEQLLAPVALYPDALLAQTLAASTYPAQVAAADQWLRQMHAQGYNDANDIVAGADAQTGWDPSIKALTAFPQVLDMLNKNLDWTTSLGNAYYNQPQDVMQTVQVLRDRAQQAGTLQSSPQEEVTEDQGNIDLAPAAPDTAYVPAYNPWAVYGAPIAPYPGFGYSLAGVLGEFGAQYAFGGLQFGAGIGLAAFEHMPWGWMGWGLGWTAHSVLFNHSAYYTRSASVHDWGFQHGGPRTPGWRGAPGFGHPVPYNRAGGYGNGRGYAQPGNRFAENGNNGWGRGETRPAFGNTHPAYPGQQAYNRAPFTTPARPQSFAPRPQTYGARPPIESRGYEGNGMYGRSPNAYNYGNRPQQSYAERPGMAYGSPYRGPAYQTPGYRAPQYGSPRGYASRPSESYGNAFARSERSGGFHMFGGGREAGGSSFRAPKSFGGGHESHSFGHASAPKMSHGGGGGHSGGGHHR